MTRDEKIAAIEKQREETRAMMFEVEEKNALAMINKFAARVRESNEIVKAQRREREKMYDSMIQAVRDEVDDSKPDLSAGWQPGWPVDPPDVRRFHRPVGN